MEVEVSKYSSFLEGYRDDLEIATGYVKEVRLGNRVDEGMGSGEHIK